MATINAENFSDYFDQSLYENHDFVEDVNNAIHENLPSKGTAHIDYETNYLAFKREEGTVDRLFTWTGDLEHSGLKIAGTIKVRAKFVGRATNHAILEFVHAWDYEDDMAD